jgi:hypothetical protein
VRVRGLPAPDRAARITAWALASLLATAGSAATEPSLELRGRWVFDKDGKAVGPEAFRRGLQLSALAWRKGELWTLGDQRGQYPGHLLRLDLASARLSAAPARLHVPEPAAGENRHFAAYREIANSDFEGLAFHPTEEDVVFAVSEDKVPWIAEIHLRAADAGEPEIVRLTELRFPKGLECWRANKNFRIEGLAISDDGRAVYFAFERATDDLPRVLRSTLEAARSGDEVELEVVPVDFAVLPRRANKGPALLNLNDIQFLRLEGRPHLVAVARDQERLILIDLEAGKVTRALDLDLRDDAGHAIQWVSPEGLAFDEASDRLWIVNDPDSERGNYRRRDEETASGNYALYAPLLFEMKLSALFARSAGSSEKAR